MNLHGAVLTAAILVATSSCVAQARKKVPRAKTPSETTVCDAPMPISSPAPAYQQENIRDQPDKTADLPSVVETVEKALECYQALSHEKDPLQPNGLPKLTNALLDFKTTTGKTVGFTFSVFVFKIGASGEKDVTSDISFTYAPKAATVPKGVGFTKKGPAPLYEELVKAVAAAASAAQAQSKLLGLPLNKVSVTVSYGIKFEGNVSLNVPVQLLTIGGNGDYNRNNTQTVTLTFGPQP